MGQLDTMLRHYLNAATRRAVLTNTQTGITLSLDLIGPVFTITATDPARAREMLQAAVQARVFTAMCTGQPLPVLDGININGGSC